LQAEQFEFEQWFEQPQSHLNSTDFLWKLQNQNFQKPRIFRNLALFSFLQ